LKEGKGKSWGVLFTAYAEPLAIYRHLRKFLIIQSEDDRELYFRYYDPRVLGVFLPTCTTDQLAEFFGPIQTFISENDEGNFSAYTFEQGKLSVDENIRIFEEKNSPDNDTQSQSKKDNQDGNQKNGGDKFKWDFY
jgi:hypothetical protein